VVLGGKHSPSGAVGAPTMDELPRDGSRRATGLTVARRSAAATPGEAADPTALTAARRPRLPRPTRPPIHRAVHEPVDYLCKTAASLCAGEEMLGIAAMPGG